MATVPEQALTGPAQPAAWPAHSIRLLAPGLAEQEDPGAALDATSMISRETYNVLLDTRLAMRSYAYCRRGVQRRNLSVANGHGGGSEV